MDILAHRAIWGVHVIGGRSHVELTADADGTFEVDGLLAGEVVVQFELRSGPDGPGRTEPRRVLLTAGETTTLDG